MDKGVLNNHKGQITCTPRTKMVPKMGADGKPEKDENGKVLMEEKTFKDVVLRPGKNRLTQEQYEAIRTNKVVQRYFDIGLLQDAKIPEGSGDFKAAKDKGDQDEVDGLPNLDKMKKDELVEFGKKKFGLELEGTNEEMRAKIVEAAEAASKKS